MECIKLIDTLVMVKAHQLYKYDFMILTSSHFNHLEPFIFSKVFYFPWGTG